jgi:hypothetical protein
MYRSGIKSPTFNFLRKLHPVFCNGCQFLASTQQREKLNRIRMKRQPTEWEKILANYALKSLNNRNVN